MISFKIGIVANLWVTILGFFFILCIPHELSGYIVHCTPSNREYHLYWFHFTYTVVCCDAGVSSLVWAEEGCLRRLG